MRPLTLKLEGLQSYKVERTVDFKKLGELGIFGIFGPTGSGKSTILDGIFLALYGPKSTPRAGGRLGAGAIVNAEHPNPDKPMCTIEFTFEVEELGEKRTCVVKRVFVPTDTGVKCKAARLTVQETETKPEQVLDKVKDVDTGVADLIGLGVEDFKRAVVLPQGQFNAFLRLGATDRANTLERLFGLERYGRDLLRRLKAVYGTAEDARKDLEGQAKGYADATDEALAESAKDLEAAKARAGLAEKELVAAEKEHERVKAEAEAEAELAAAETQLTTVEVRAEDVDQARVELEAARAAEVLRGTLQSQEKLAEKLPALENEASKRQAQAEEAETERTQLERGYQELLTSTARERPALVTRQTRLTEDGRKIAQDLSGQVKDLEEREHEYKATEASEKKQADALEAAAKLRDELRNDLDAKRVRRKKLAQGSPGKEVARLKAAVEFHEQVGKRQGEFEGAEQDQRRRQEKLEEAAVAVAKSKEDLKEAHDKAKEATDALEAAKNEHGKIPRSSELDEQATQQAEVRRNADALGDAETKLRQCARTVEAKAAEAKTKAEQVEAAGEVLTEAERGREQAEQECDLAREALAALETQDRAVVLAATLQAGEQCAVCGSTEHPHPASAADPDALAAALVRVPKAEGALTAASQARETAATDHAKLQASLEGAEKILAEQRLVQGDAEAGEQKIRALTRPGLAEQDAEARTRALEVEDERIRKDKEALRVSEKTVRGLEQATADATRDVTKLTGGRTTAEAELKAAGEQLGTAAKTVDSKRGELADAKARLEKERGETPADELGEQLERVKKDEKELDELETLIEALAEQLPALETKLETTRKSRDGFATQLTLIKGDLEGKQAAIKALRARLEELTSGEDLETLIKALVGQLADLEERVRQAKVKAENAAKDADAKAKASDDARVRVGEAKKQIKALIDQLAGMLQRGKVTFAAPEDARQALREPAKREALSQEVEGFGKDLAAAKARLKKAKEKAGSERIAPNALADAKQARDTARAEQKIAIGERAAQERGHEQLVEQNRKGRDIAKGLETANLRTERLGTILGLLRGNALVEYVAAGQLRLATSEASARLSKFSRGNFGLQLDANQNFVIRDDFSGGRVRPLTSLSGGETFLAALSMALALAELFQSRGTRRIRFFFLDEGFGTLDGEKLDQAVKALEDVARDDRVIGVISHVEELKSRLQRKLVVTAATADGEGSDVRIVD
ncbi:MAG: AAA family ATPase [Planctomycetes bacterium]|nr:AAA family ATPase [Planctomycetota bacterium]